MAGDINDSIKNLQTSINNLDTNLKTLSKTFYTDFVNAVKSSTSDASKFFDDLAKKVGARDANKLRLMFEMVDSNGKVMTADAIQKEIDRITKGRKTKDGQKVQIGIKWVGIDEAEQRLKMLREQLRIAKTDEATLLTRTQNIVNKAGVRYDMNKLSSSNTSARLADERRATEMIIAEYRKRKREKDAKEKEIRRLEASNTNARIQDERRATQMIDAELRKRRNLRSSNAAAQVNDERRSTQMIEREYERRRNAAARTAERQRREQQRLNDEMRNMLPTLQRIGYAFGIAFSVQGLVQFGKKLIETRGQFELQQVAMRSILQNKQLADEIWDKTMQAALQSPFTAMQLTKYTKQLAAYRIETDKLFDTTKRLADVSAGLGVDMQRLILAYGQVKAANYLRASEIRQFTEAGVNILGELRDYFNEVKGMSVNTAKVMDMVQKRMVKFEDVEAIFKRMTDEGGIFYNMQYIQSQTVSGQINKLHDAYDQMLNSIGKANQGALKNMVHLLLSIVQNWREWKTVLDSIAIPALVVALLKFGKGLITVGASARIASKEIYGLELAGTKLRRGLGATLSLLKKFPGGIAGAAVAMAAFVAATALYNHYKAVEAINKEYDELKNRLRETARSFEDYQKKVDENNKIISEGSGDVAKAQKENQKIVKKLQEDYPEFAKSIKLAADKQADLGTIVNDVNEKLREQAGLLEASKGDFFTQDTRTNIKQYQESVLKQEDETENNYTLALNAYEDFVDKREIALAKLKHQYEDGEISLSRYNREVEKQNKKSPDKWITGILDAGKDSEKQASFLSGLVRLPKGVVIPKGEITNYGVEEFDKDLSTREKDLRKNLQNWAPRIRRIYVHQLEKLNGGVIDDVKSYVKQNGTLIDNWFAYGTGIGWKNINEDIVKIATQLGVTLDEAREIFENEVNNTLSSAYGKTIKLDWSKSDDSKTDTETAEEKQAKIDAAWRRRIQLLEEMKKRYDELSKSAYGYAKSNTTVRAEFEKSWKKIFGGVLSMDAIRFMTDEDMEAAFETLLAKAGGVSEAVKEELQKKSDSYGAKKPIDVAVRIREDFGRQMEDAFNNYELTLDLQKLNLPKGLASELWGVDKTTLDGLRTKLSYIFTELKDENGELSKDAFKDYQNFLNKIDDLERKQQRERLKEYAKYLEYQYSERAKIEMEYVRKLADLETIAMGETQKEQVREGLRKDFEEKSRKQDWEDFKGSEFYVQMMEDLERQSTASLDVMKEKLLEMRKNAENLSPRALKEVVNALEKIEKIESERKEPLKRYRDALKELGDGDALKNFRDLAAAQKELGNIEQQERELDKMIMLEQELNRLKDEGITLDEEEAKKQLEIARKTLTGLQNKISAWRSSGVKEDDKALVDLLEKANVQNQFVLMYEAMVKSLAGGRTIESFMGNSPYKGLGVDTLIGKKETLKNEKNDILSVIDALNNWVNKYKELKDAESKLLDYIKEWSQEVIGIYDSVLDTIDYFTDETYGLTAAWKEFGDTSVSTLNTLISGIQTYQKAQAQWNKDNANKGVTRALINGDSIQLMLVALGVILKMIQAVAKLRDSYYDKTIQKQQDRINSLTDAYARLERQIERTWQTSSYMTAYNEQLENLRQQIQALEAQRAAEESKKNTDPEKVRGYTNAINDAYDSMEDLQEKQIEVFGGIGESGYRSWAEGFVDAWKSAFLETGDGLDALQDHFDEFLQEWFVKQATMRIAGAALQNVMGEIDNVVSDDGRVNWQELQNIRERMAEILPELNERLTEFAGWWDLDSEGNLSGLAAGIQGMTEEQANILEAYWNSVRLYTANIDMNVQRIADILGVGGVNTNPMLLHLQTIADNSVYIQRIYNMLTPMQVNGGSGHGFRTYAM